MRRLIIAMISLSLTFSACGGGGGGSNNGGQSGSTAPPPKLSTPLPQNIKSKGKLNVGVKCDYPPFGYIDESGDHAGFGIDLARELAYLAFGDRNAVSLQCVTSDNRIPFLTNGRVDLLVATITYTEDRAKVINFSTPYFQASGRMLVKKGSNIHTVQDLAGKTVTSTKGALYVDWFQRCMPSVRLLQLEETSQSVQALTQGRADAFVQDDTLLVSIASKNDDLEIQGKGIETLPWGLGTRKDDKAFGKWVDAALARLQKQDYFWKDFKKWVTQPELRQEFAQGMPRPDHDLHYPASAKSATSCSQPGAS